MLGSTWLKAFLNPPSSSIARLVSSPSLGPPPVTWTSAHCGVRCQLGVQTQEIHIEWKVEEHCLCKEKVRTPPGMQSISKEEHTWVTLLIGMMSHLLLFYKQFVSPLFAEFVVRTVILIRQRWAKEKLGSFKSIFSILIFRI